MNNKRAFSLIELSIVILIVGIIVAGVTQSSSLVTKMRISSARNLTNSSPVAGIAGLTYWIESVGTQRFATGSGGNYADSESLNDNQDIGRWNDINPQSTNKINLTQSTSTRQPSYVIDGINDLPSVKFDSSQNDCLLSQGNNGGLIASANEVTLFVVEQFQGNTATDLNSVLFLGDAVAGDNRINIHSPASGSIIFDSGNWRDNYRTSVTAPANFNLSPYIITGTRNNETSKIFLNGLNAGTVSGVATSKIDLNTSLNIGCSYQGNMHFKGLIGEIIIYNRALKNEERQSVESYLSKKWGIKL